MKSKCDGVANLAEGNKHWNFCLIWSNGAKKVTTNEMICSMIILLCDSERGENEIIKLNEYTHGELNVNNKLL